MILLKEIFRKVERFLMSYQIEALLKGILLLVSSFATIIFVSIYTQSQILISLSIVALFIIIIGFECLIKYIKTSIGHYIYGGKAHGYYNDRNYPKAIKYYSIAILFGPKDRLNHYSRGYAKIQMQDYEGAIKDFDVLIELEPWNYFHFLLRGLCKHMINNQENAIKDFDQSIAMYPDAIETYYFRGIAKRIIGDEIGALKDLRGKGLNFEKPDNALNYYFPKHNYYMAKASTYN